MRNYHEESLLIVAAFCTYIVFTETSAEIYDRTFVLSALAVVVVYWAVRTIRRYLGRRMT